MKTVLIRSMLCFGFLVLGGGSTAFAEAVTDRYDDTFRKYTQRFFGPGYDWRIFKAQAMAESNLNMNAKSWVGARGLMQLMPSTFKEVRTKNPEIVSIDKPEWNIAAGIYYDRQLWKQWTDQQGNQGSEPFMLASYNAGRGTLLRAQDVARLGRRRTAGAAKLSIGLIETCFENEVVRAREAVDATDWPGGARADCDGRSDQRHQDDGAAPSEWVHVTLVRSCCFSACRSRASATSRSSSEG